MSDRLRDKRALVTGADRGIGRAIAIGLAEAGADVAVLYNSGAEAAAHVVASIGKTGRNAIAIQADVSAVDQVRNALDLAERALGGLDILVNNSGVTARTPFLDVTENEFDRILAVNLKGTFLVSQYAATLMIASRTRGSIINVTSTSAQRAALGLVPYQASKAGVTMLTQGMALELAPYLIRVNEICPGVTETDINRAVLADPDVRAQRIGAIPLGRLGTPEDHVGAAVYLASDESSFVTGSTIIIDGGISVKAATEKPDFRAREARQ
jgi:NAD(P)-dependent dehydrogenase (short-subunit alcohol dehydrogenase family)